jgi:plasmid stabilization system protein ParE
MTSNGSATTLLKAVLNPRVEWRSLWSSASGRLETFPHLGRPGRVQGTREMAFPPLPFIAIYEVFETQGEVRVLRILHGAQQWPPR